MDQHGGAPRTAKGASLWLFDQRNRERAPPAVKLCDSLCFLPPGSQGSDAAAGPSSAARVLPLIERQTSVPLLVLWNVFLFWVQVAVTHSDTLFMDTVLETALGICFIVGITLNTNAYAMWAETRQVPEVAEGEIHKVDPDLGQL